MKNTREIGKWVRLSGTPEERESMEYTKKVLEGYGYTAKIIDHDAFISLPGDAKVTVDGSNVDFGECRTHCFATQTPPEGVAGELVYIGNATPAEIAGLDLKGKITLAEGLASGERNIRLEKAGVAGQIYIQDQYLRMMTVNPLWGSPTPETAHLIPTCPGVTLTAEGGKKLKDLLTKGKVIARIHAKDDIGWRKIPELVADLPAGGEGKYVLLSCHIDSWYYGIMDNGTANALILEVARIAALNQAALKRGVRVIMWSGHSHGRFAGSSWYADHYFEDLYDNCVAHVNSDSPGGKGAVVIDEGPIMAETKALAADSIKKVTGEGFIGKRINRFGDQSMVGVGLSSIFATFSEQDATKMPEGTLKFSGTPGHRSGGLGWWWHNENDTIDKIDEDFLVRDTKIYVNAVWHLLTDPVLPFDFAATAQEFVDVLSDYQKKAAGKADLSRAIDVAKQVGARATELNAKVAKAGTGISAATAAKVNQCLLGLSRTLVPIGYTINGPFGQDLGMSLPPVPGLRDAAALGQAPAGSDTSYMLHTVMVRQANRVLFGLRRALEILDETLASL